GRRRIASATCSRRRGSFSRTVPTARCGGVPDEGGRAMTGDRVYLFDTTLRDGAQTPGVDFSVADKIAIARRLDQLGIDYVEGGWPGANPTDDAFFRDPPRLEHAT